MGLQIWLAARGFKSIAKFERYTVPVTFCVLIVMTIVAWSKNNVHWGYAGAHLHGWALLSAESTIMTAIGIGWGCTWFAYTSDYSRFLPKDAVAFQGVLCQCLRAVPPGRLARDLRSDARHGHPEGRPGRARRVQLRDPGHPGAAARAARPDRHQHLEHLQLFVVRPDPGLEAQPAQDRPARRRHRAGVHHRPRLPEQLRQHLGQLVVRTGDVDRPVGQP